MSANALSSIPVQYSPFYGTIADEKKLNCQKRPPALNPKKSLIYQGAK